MNVKRIHIIYSVLFSCLSFFTGYLLSEKFSSESRYIKLGKVYDSFTMTRELEHKLTMVQQANEKVLDSLMVDLKLLANELENSEYESKEQVKTYQLLREQYLVKEEQFKNNARDLSNRYNEQVWSQLNEYLKDYGKERGYRFIFGTTGQGNLMYANESDDVTEEAIAYVNDRYQGNIN